MATLGTIKPADREFLQLVARTAFCNPFSEERASLDAQIVGHPVDPFSEAHLDEMTRVISKRAEQLQSKGLADIRKYAARDSDLVRTFFLFEVYHCFCGEFDQLILEQARQGAESLPVKFADRLLERLRARGFGNTESVRFLGIFYQLRRAFHFIVRGLIGRSPCMRELRSHLWQNVFTREVRVYDRYLWNRMEDFSTLLLGETGTGKGAAAAAVGRSGYIPFDEKRGRFAESFARSFISLNLSQFPETLIESELFGHRKGAFTGAVEAHEGVLARCSPHGAIFLDEIGDVTVPIQIKLLQVLQERTFCPVGSHDFARFRGRVIAATNQPLAALRSQKLFREDFFYRLSSDIIEVPPLRQRLQEDPDELSQLVEHIFTSIVGQRDRELQERVEQGIVSALGKSYSWPGNVRELAQAVRQVLLTGVYKGTADQKSSTPSGVLLAGFQNLSLTADQLLAGYCALLYDKTRNYEEVARRTKLDRRTVKKYVSNR